MTNRVRTLAEKLFKEIEEISGCRLSKLGICLHDGFSGQLCAPLSHLPAQYSGNTIHFLADVDWRRKASENLLKEKHLSNALSFWSTLFVVTKLAIFLSCLEKMRNIIMLHHAGWRKAYAFLFRTSSSKRGKRY